MVNRHGARFVNEAHKYSDMGHVLHAFDPAAFDFANLPAWLILHQGRLDRSMFVTKFPSDPIPNWLVQAPTLRELATKIEVDPDGLEATVARFNANAVQGKDPDFHRGESAFDRYNRDSAREGALQTLGPLDQPPFFAIRIYPGALSTKGGPKTNARAEVLNLRGGVIAGLYAAGNAMASMTGMAYPVPAARLVPRSCSVTSPAGPPPPAATDFQERPMPSVEHSKIVHAPLAEIWAFVRDMDRWAPLLTGYERHIKLSEQESIWVLKGKIAGLTRVAEFKVHIDEWDETGHVSFRLDGLNEPVSGSGTSTQPNFFRSMAPCLRSLPRPLPLFLGASVTLLSGCCLQRFSAAKTVRAQRRFIRRRSAPLDPK